MQLGDDLGEIATNIYIPIESYRNRNEICRWFTLATKVALESTTKMALKNGMCKRAYRKREMRARNT